MHMILCFEISASGQRKTEIEKLIAAKMKPYSWARVFAGTYVVKMADADQRTALIDGLLDVSKNSPEKVYFIASPPMVGGRYNGWLPKNTWANINARSGDST